MKRTTLRSATIDLGGDNMETNLSNISKIMDYSEAHLEDELELENLANVAGYSKYQFHRMFTDIVGLSLHSYVQRRRLTEAIRLLIFTNQPIMQIALFAGYETQQSFSVAIKELFQCSPQALRKKKEFIPLQLKFTVDGKKNLRGDKIMDIHTMEHNKIVLVGYTGNTKEGFSIIGNVWECFKRIKTKSQIAPMKIVLSR